MEELERKVLELSEQQDKVQVHKHNGKTHETRSVSQSVRQGNVGEGKLSELLFILVCGVLGLIEKC